MNSLNKVIIFIFVILTCACHHSSQISKEPWVNKASGEWPNIVLRNRITLKDSTLDNFANACVITYNNDTLGITCKHLFLALKNMFGIRYIQMQPSIQHWELYSSNSSTPVELWPSANPEQVGDFNTLKSNDWIILHPLKPFQNVYPLTIRWKPVLKGETVYALVRHAQQNVHDPQEIRSFTCFKNMGPYYYMKATNEQLTSIGTSGSPVIDSNGHLIGLTSGQEGQLTVIANVEYLKNLLINRSTNH